MCTLRVSGRRDPTASGVIRTFTAPWTNPRRGLSPASLAAAYLQVMNKAHVTLGALLFAAAAVLGAVAVTHTTGLGRAARNTNDAAIAARTKQLATFAAKLQKELKAKPPALPPVPKPKAVPAAAAAPAAPQAPRIVYHQPPPVVVTIHKHHGDDGTEGGGGGGGGGDD
jgi:hypothetical protein